MAWRVPVRRHGHRGAAVRALAALLLLVALTVAVTRGDAGRTRVSSTGPRSSTSSAGAAGTEPTLGPVTTEAQAATTTTGSATTGTATAGTATAGSTPTTEPAAVATTVPAATTVATTNPCRNSADPACGPFRFEPPPGEDRPMTVSVTTDPAPPRAGEQFTFRVALDDPDGASYNGFIVDYGDGVAIGTSHVEQCQRYGPWDPPAPDPAAAVDVVELTHTYAAPGTYVARFAFDAGPFDCTDPVTGRGDRPYASSASGEAVVVVEP